MGSDTTNTDTVSGEAANLALQFHSIASPGSVVIDAITRNLVGNLFVCRDLGLSELAGVHGRTGFADS